MALKTSIYLVRGSDCGGLHGDSSRVIADLEFQEVACSVWSQECSKDVSFLPPGVVLEVRMWFVLCSAASLLASLSLTLRRSCFLCSRKLVNYEHEFNYLSLVT